MKRLNRLYLIRHGQTEGYEEFPVYGHTDVDITETGRLQMRLVAERVSLSDIKAVYASDLKRAVLGARYIARHHDIPLYYLPELREMLFGDWEGLKLAEVRKRFPRELEERQADLLNFQIPGGGESIAVFSQRILACFEQIRSEQNGNDFAMVVHGGVNRVILCDALKLDLSNMFRIHQDYGCLNIIDYFNDSTVVRLVNG